jgi:hypothetical protein
MSFPSIPKSGDCFIDKRNPTNNKITFDNIVLNSKCVAFLSFTGIDPQGYQYINLIPVESFTKCLNLKSIVPA